MVGLCLGLIKIGSCKTAKVDNKTIINKQSKIITDIITESLNETVATSTDSLSNLIDVWIESEGTVIIKDFDISQYVGIKSDTDMKVIDMAKSNVTVDKIVDNIVDVAIKENASTELGGGGTTVASASVIEDIKNEIKNNVKMQFTHVNKFECIHNAMNAFNLTIHHKGSQGDVTITGFKIDQKIEELSKCIINAYIDSFNNIEISESIQTKIDNNLEEESTTYGFSIKNIAIVIIVIVMLFVISGMVTFGISSYLKYRSKSSTHVTGNISQNQTNKT